MHRRAHTYALIQLQHDELYKSAAWDSQDESSLAITGEENARISRRFWKCLMIYGCLARQHVNPNTYRFVKPSIYMGDQ